MSDLPAGECRLGYPVPQWEAIVLDHGRSIRDFEYWMRGQTMALCEGKDCSTVHGPVVYGHDLRRFLDRGPIFD